MVVAGEASGDLLAVELVEALREECGRRYTQPSDDLQPLRTGLVPQFFGAGGPRMAEAGVELAFDMTRHSVIGLWEALKDFGQFKRLFDQLLGLALERQPDAVICVDFCGFNRRFGHAVRQRVRAQRGTFNNWKPGIIQYVSPQVWASRPGRARQLARDFDLLLAIFEFEKEWYAKWAPGFRVEFVGHPIVDRFRGQARKPKGPGNPPLVLLLPGSRAGELTRHLPVLLEAARRLQSQRTLRLRMVLPDETLAAQARAMGSSLPGLEIQADGLADWLAEADVAIASTGTVTLECAWFGVPTVAIYRTSWGTYQVARRIVQVGFIAMPNLLVGTDIYPELVQSAATPENIAREATDLLDNEARRTEIKAKLAKVSAWLGKPGASERAAKAILDLVEQR